MKIITTGATMIIITFFSCVGAMLLNYAGTYLAIQNRFCTKENSVYQAIVSKSEDLVSWFPDRSVAVSGNSIMTTLDGRQFRIEAYWGQLTGTPDLLYVNVGTDIDSLRGSEGFLFLLPDRSIPQFWYDHYWITRLEGNIFCFEIRGF